jgi:glycogen debranching enzyme
MVQTQQRRVSEEERARGEAERVLLANGGELGLLGSQSAYQQVWARDSMICGLGLLLCADPEGAEIHRRSLETLRTYQSALGSVAHNVGIAGVRDPALLAHGGSLEEVSEAPVAVRDTIHAGCVDSNLWYIIGHYYNFIARGDRELLERAWDSLERALLWLRYQDSNECGLLEVHEAMDWADLFVNRYNVLYDNVLYFAAWQCMAQMADAIELPSDFYHHNASDVRRKVNAVLWVGPEEPRDWDWIAGTRREWLYTLKRIETELVERPFYLPYVAFRDYADRFDTLSNLLAIVFGVADQFKAGKILDYLHGCGLDRPYPVRALYPVINPGERDWREYYRVRNLNLPHHYHNGGAWPFIGGFYVVALVQAGRTDEARKQLARLTAMNRRGKVGQWGFNEWFHGLSGQPMGYDHQSWSAALYIFAQDCVEQGWLNVFNPEHGWGNEL